MRQAPPAHVPLSSLTWALAGRLTCWLRRGWLRFELSDRDLVVRLHSGTPREQADVYKVDWSQIIGSRRPTSEDVVLDAENLRLVLGQKVQVMLTALIEAPETPPLPDVPPKRGQLG